MISLESFICVNQYFLHQLLVPWPGGFSANALAQAPMGVGIRQQQQHMPNHWSGDVMTTHAQGARPWQILNGA